MKIAPVCPVSEQRVDETTVRLIAFFVALLTVISLYFNYFFIALLLCLDFSLRAFTDGNLSVLKQLAIRFTFILKLPRKPVNAAPKKFAAAMGVLFSGIIFILQMAGLSLPALITGGLLAGCALLESAFGVCVGCYLYSYIVMPLKHSIRQH